MFLVRRPSASQSHSQQLKDRTSTQATLSIASLVANAFIPCTTPAIVTEVSAIFVATITFGK
jgi:hypothetical protein